MAIFRLDILVMDLMYIGVLGKSKNGAQKKRSIKLCALSRMQAEKL